MEKIKEFLSPAGRDKLAAYTKKQGSFPLYVVGVHVNELELTCSKPKQASGQKSTGLPSITSYRKKMEWHGATDFVVPPSCFDFLCTKDSAYRDVLSAFLKESVLELIKKPVDGAVIAAFSFPVHSLWDDSAAALQDLLDRCFADCGWVLPAVVSVFDNDLNVAEQFCVYADKNWTTFRWGKGRKTSVAYGTGTDFRDFRCNDYLNNGTNVWSCKSFSSWEEGFMDICRVLSDSGKKASKDTFGFADACFHRAIQDAVIKSKLSGNPVSWVDPASISAQILLNCFEKFNSASKGSNAKQTAAGAKGNHSQAAVNKDQVKERQVKTAEDLFKW